MNSHLALILSLWLSPLACAQVYDATFPTAEHPKAAALLLPGMKAAFWCDMGTWMCPPATRNRVGPSLLLPKGHPYAWFNPQEADLDRIIAEANRRKLAGADPLVILDFEAWTQSPATFGRIAELLQYFKIKSGRPACFYPGQVSAGFVNDGELIDMMAGKLTPMREAELATSIAKASVVYAACDQYVIDYYAYDEAQLLSGSWERVLEASARHRARYYPAREVIPFAGAHYGLMKDNPPIKPEHLAHYNRVISKYSTKGRVVVWGNATPGMKLLARLALGQAIDQRAIEEDAKLKMDLTHLVESIQNTGKKSTTQPSK